LSASRTDSSRGEPDSAGRLPACRCSDTPSRTLGCRDRLEAYPRVAGIQQNIDSVRFSANFRASSAKSDLPIGVHPINPFTVWSIALPVYGLFTAILGRSFFMIQNFPVDLFRMAAATSLRSGRYKGGPPNLTVTWLEQFCVPASHTL
jgi:hypothetical protein